jgi:hypothetical protein
MRMNADMREILFPSDLRPSVFIPVPLDRCRIYETVSFVMPAS